MPHANKTPGGRIALGSITYATKAQRLLADSGIRAPIVRLTGGGGCSYALQISPRELRRARQLLDSAGIPYSHE